MMILNGIVYEMMGFRILNKLIPAVCQMTISESLYQRVRTIKTATNILAVSTIGRLLIIPRPIRTITSLGLTLPLAALPSTLIMKIVKTRVTKTMNTTPMVKFSSCRSALLRIIKS